MGHAILPILVDGSNGSAPQAHIGEVEADETGPSGLDLETDEPEPDLSEPEAEAEISGQMAGNAPAE